MLMQYIINFHDFKVDPFGFASLHTLLKKTLILIVFALFMANTTIVLPVENFIEIEPFNYYHPPHHPTYPGK